MWIYSNKAKDGSNDGSWKKIDNLSTYCPVSGIKATRVSLHVGFMAARVGIPSPRWSTWLSLWWHPSCTNQKKKDNDKHTAAPFTMPPSLLPHHSTKCLPITVLHIRMPPRLPQRTKQRYAKQSGNPTHIVMRCTVWESGELCGGGVGKTRWGGLLALKRGTCGDTTPTVWWQKEAGVGKK